MMFLVESISALKFEGYDKFDRIRVAVTAGFNEDSLVKLKDRLEDIVILESNPEKSWADLRSKALAHFDQVANNPSLVNTLAIYDP